MQELLRRSEVTRLGHGVDADGSLSEESMQRVLRTLDDYRAAIDAHDCEANIAVLTSAVRDAPTARSSRPACARTTAWMRAC